MNDNADETADARRRSRALITAILSVTDGATVERIADELAVEHSFHGIFELAGTSWQLLAAANPADPLGLVAGFDRRYPDPQVRASCESLLAAHHSGNSKAAQEAAYVAGEGNGRGAIRDLALIGAAACQEVAVLYRKDQFAVMEDLAWRQEGN